VGSARVPTVVSTPRHVASLVRRRTAGGRLLRAFVTAVTAAMLISLFAVGSVAASGGGTRYVATSGSDANSCSRSAPCLTIGHALDVAVPGSRVIVRHGRYHEQVFVTRQVHLIGRHATIDATGLLGSLPPLDGFGIIGMGLTIMGPGAAGSVVEGFRVENAPAEGILAVMTSDVTIRHNEVVHNDQGATTAFDPLPAECAAQGEVPGDCGEGIHLLSVTDSHVAWNDVHDNVGGFLLTDEVGPTSGNRLVHNVSRNNKLDCGFTLPSHNADALADPSKGGVYDNVIKRNVSVGNGGAGVGMFAPFPGAASYDNRVVENLVLKNGEAGIAIHSHTPGQNLSGNVIRGNWVAGNGVDPDFVDMTTHIGIMLGSVAVPVDVVVRHNHVAKEDVGIYRSGPITVHGLRTNRFAGSVGTRVV
jgi:nitrous oxidase accessory protein NosD